MFPYAHALHLMPISNRLLLNSNSTLLHAMLPSSTIANQCVQHADSCLLSLHFIQTIAEET
jgi:hypothetical protein